MASAQESLEGALGEKLNSVSNLVYGIIVALLLLFAALFFTALEMINDDSSEKKAIYEALVKQVTENRTQLILIQEDLDDIKEILQ